MRSERHAKLLTGQDAAEIDLVQFAQTRDQLFGTPNVLRNVVVPLWLLLFRTPSLRQTKKHGWLSLVWRRRAYYAVEAVRRLLMLRSRVRQQHRTSSSAKEGHSHRSLRLRTRQSDKSRN
jgi:hypothetical protein